MKVLVSKKKKKQRDSRKVDSRRTVGDRVHFYPRWAARPQNARPETRPAYKNQQTNGTRVAATSRHACTYTATLLRYIHHQTTRPPDRDIATPLTDTRDKIKIKPAATTALAKLPFLSPPQSVLGLFVVVVVVVNLSEFLVWPRRDMHLPQFYAEYFPKSVMQYYTSTNTAPPSVALYFVSTYQPRYSSTTASR